MESSHQWLINKHQNNTKMISLLVVEHAKHIPLLTEGCDRIYLILCEHADDVQSVYYYIKDGKRIQERWMNRDVITEYLGQESHSFITTWLMKGQILIDRHHAMDALRQYHREAFDNMRELTIFVVFSRFLNHYLQSKHCHSEEQLLDAYQFLLAALHQWATVVILQAGQEPEDMIWQQVQTINPGVFKLYEELTMSKETIKQRIELVVLACEFSISSKIEVCCEPLLRILREREEPWPISELYAHPMLSSIQSILVVMLNKLIRKGLVQEFEHARNEQLTEVEPYYHVTQKT